MGAMMVNRPHGTQARIGRQPSETRGAKKKRPELDSKNKQVEIRIFFCFVAAIAQLSANVVKPGIVKWTVIQPHDGELSE